MKFFLKLSTSIALIASTSSYALDPMPGTYTGVFIGGSFASAVDINYTNIATPTVVRTGKLKYAGFGNLGGMVGYRVDQFRVEAELFFNQSPYKSLTINQRRYLHSRSGKHSNSATGFHYTGRTTAGSLMVNGFYDFYFMSTQSNFVPYVGLGLGYSRVENHISPKCNNAPVTITNTCSLDFNVSSLNNNLYNHANTGGGQVIIGVNYFLDDYSTFGLDFREFSTRKISSYNSRYQFSTINVSFSGAFDFW